MLYFGILVIASNFLVDWSCLGEVASGGNTWRYGRTYSIRVMYKPRFGIDLSCSNHGHIGVEATTSKNMQTCFVLPAFIFLLISRPLSLSSKTS